MTCVTTADVGHLGCVVVFCRQFRNQFVTVELITELTTENNNTTPNPGRRVWSRLLTSTGNKARAVGEGSGSWMCSFPDARLITSRTAHVSLLTCLGHLRLGRITNGGQGRENDRDRAGTQEGDGRDKVGTQEGDGRDKVGAQEGDGRYKVRTHEGDGRDKVRTQEGDGRDKVRTQEGDGRDKVRT